MLRGVQIEVLSNEREEHKHTEKKDQLSLGGLERGCLQHSEWEEEASQGGGRGS